MNITKNLQDRIENRLTETKTPCKLYASEATATKAADKLAKSSAEYFGASRPTNYIIVKIESVNKFAIGFDINGLLARPETHGGYVGIFGANGHYSY